MTVVLALNAGSSSLKTALFVDGGEGDRLLVSDAQQRHDYGVAEVMAWIERAGHPVPDAVGHRMVHGGTHFRAPVLVDEKVRKRLDELTPLAPLHMPLALTVIDAVTKLLPLVDQVVCFDTAFHATLPRVAYDLSLPQQLEMRRYGFHGLNLEHVVDVLGPKDLGRAVVAHLGSGCSVTALRDGKSVDTSMGFTPNGGVPMATRSGDLDPGVVFALLRSGRPLAEVEDIVERHSGLLGWSGGVADMQSLLDAPDQDFAVDAFCTHIAKAVAAMTVSLNGIDTLVFTGGIGEHASTVRDGIVQKLTHLGPMRILVVPADEERAIARSVDSVVNANGRSR